MLKAIARSIFGVIPAESELLYRAAQRYVDRYNGDNNSNPSTNGEEHLLRTVIPKLRGGIVFDVGANVGAWSRHCLSIDDGLQIHLFEPSKGTFGRLSGTPWPPATKLCNFGLGERNESLDLHVVDSGSGMNTIHRRQGVVAAEGSSTEPIEIRRLDDYCIEHQIDRIDYLKVDVEGHELAVFKGGRQMLERGAVDLIQFEYGGCNLDAGVYLLHIWEYLAQYGYRIGKIYPAKVQSLQRYHQRFETFRYCNYLAYTADCPYKHLLDVD